MTDGVNSGRGGSPVAVVVKASDAAWDAAGGARDECGAL